MLVAVNQN